MTLGTSIKCHYSESSLFIVMLNVIILSVVMLSVGAPPLCSVLGIPL
jgi:hypothetical protein